MVWRNLRELKSVSLKRKNFDLAALWPKIQNFSRPSTRWRWYPFKASRKIRFYSQKMLSRIDNLPVFLAEFDIQWFFSNFFVHMKKRNFFWFPHRIFGTLAIFDFWSKLFFYTETFEIFDKTPLVDCHGETSLSFFDMVWSWWFILAMVWSWQDHGMAVMFSNPGRLPLKNFSVCSKKNKYCNCFADSISCTL